MATLPYVRVPKDLQKGCMTMDRSILEQIDPRVLGARLQDARKAAGLTQQAVADQMQMARTTVVSIEKGERRVTLSEIVEFAKLYKRPVSDLVSRRLVTESFVPQFRATEREVLEEHADFEQAAIELQRLAEDYAELERIAGAANSRSWPPPYDVGGAGAEQFAAYVASTERNRLGVGDGPIGNLRQRLETDAGLRIFYYRMPSRIAGLFAFNEPLGACVGINLLHPRDRRQWSLAHEFGHFLMHRYRAEITVLEVRRHGNSSERVADAFAENFLLPAGGLERRVTEMTMGRPTGITLADIVSLADLYQVSVQALILRLETLRRLPAGTWERLKAEGFKPQQAQRLLGIDANPPLAETLPRRYVALAVEAFRRGELSEGQLSRYLRTDRISARLQVEAAQRQIYSEQDEFAGLSDLDLAAPLTSR
jgi:Zn-dependent peptidase ImmA (M78 family)/DNA-binding XRE family transcriptional regulator